MSSEAVIKIAIDYYMTVRAVYTISGPSYTRTISFHVPTYL